MSWLLRFSMAIFLVFDFSQNVLFSQIEPYGLEGKNVTALALLPERIFPWGNYLCAATDSHGVFLRQADTPFSLWTPIGLENKKITALNTYYWGIGPGQFNTIFAGVQPEVTMGDSTLFYQYTFGMGANWMAADSGLNAGQIQTVEAVAGIYFYGHTPFEPVFLGTDSGIYWSFGVPGGMIWQFGHPGWIHALQIFQTEMQKIVWAGGETDFFSPLLLKSTNKGASWDNVSPPISSNRCLSLAIHPQNPDTVYAGLNGMVLKTTDGGLNWGVHPVNMGAIKGIVINPSNPDHLVIGGESVNQEFALWESFDAGANWREIYPPSPLAAISSIVADTMGGKFVVSIATLGDGVYRYQSPLSSLDSPPARYIPRKIVFFPNYPNPFNAITHIKFQLPTAGTVDIEIYDVRGNIVWESNQHFSSGGFHSISWDASAFASGIYICRLRLGNIYSRPQKMVLVR
ncbi:MAG: hypothetical protein Kow0042_06820 [Calditrichia bacterium]